MTLIELELFTNDPTYQIICENYWELTSEQEFKFSVSELAKKYGIKSQKLLQFISDNSNAYSSRIKCNNCGTKYIFSNRSDFQRQDHSDTVKWFCPNCTSKIKEKELLDKKELEKQQQIIIGNVYDLALRNPLDINTCSFEDAVSFLALVRIGASEDFQSIAPLWSIKQLLAPTRGLFIETIKQLYKNDLIYVHPYSSPDAFEFENNKPSSFYIERVMWALPISVNSQKSSDFVSELENIFLNMNWPNEWFEQRLEFCKKIALQECLQYLEVSLVEHKLMFNPGEKTYLVFNNLLQDFAVAQIYNFIWRAAKDAAAFYVREQVPKQHAANTVVGSIQRQAEKARSEGWDVKAYRRDFRCPESMISQVLYNTVLHIGDEGFNKPLK